MITRPDRLWRAGRRLALPTLLLLTASAASDACARRAPDTSTVDVRWTLAPAAPVVGSTTLSITVRERAGRPVSGATVRLEGHMSHAGMAPILAAGSERTPGAYEIPFAFTMPGDWVLVVSVTLPDGTRVERRVDVSNVRPAG